MLEENVLNIDTIVNIATYSCGIKYGNNIISDKKYEKFTKMIINEYEEFIKTVDKVLLNGYLLTSECFIPKFINNIYTIQLEKEFSKIENTLNKNHITQFKNDHFFIKMDGYQYQMNDNIMTWKDENDLVLGTAIVTPIFVLEKYVQDLNYKHMYLKSLKLMWSWRDNFIEHLEEQPNKKNYLRELKRIRKFIKSVKNQKFNNNGLLFTNIYNQYLDMSVHHSIIYSIWLKNNLNYDYCYCPCLKLTNTLVYSFYLLKDIKINENYVPHPLKDNNNKEFKINDLEIKPKNIEEKKNINNNYIKPIIDIPI